MVKWITWAVSAYTLYSVIGISAFVGTNPNIKHSFSWIGTAEDGNVERNMQFAAFIAVHGALGCVVYSMLLECKKYWRRALLPVLIFAFEYATGSIGVRNDHVPHNVCAIIAFCVNLLAALYALFTHQLKRVARNHSKVLKNVGVIFILAAAILLIVFVSANCNVCEWIALYFIALLPAYILFFRTNEEIDIPLPDIKNRQTWIKALYVLGTLCGCFAAAWELHHIQLRYNDKKNGKSGRQNWGSPLTLALYKLFIFSHAYNTFKQHSEHKWLHWIPIIITTSSFVLWTTATGIAMHYDGQSYAHVLGTTLGGLLLPALVINAVLLWPTKNNSSLDAGLSNAQVDPSDFVESNIKNPKPSKLTTLMF